MASYTIEQTLTTCTTGRVELPEGKTWADVKDFGVKWDTLHVKFYGDEFWHELSINSQTDDITDWKRPERVVAYSVDEDGDTDYSDVVAEF